MKKDILVVLHELNAADYYNFVYYIKIIIFSKLNYNLFSASK